MRWLRMQWMSLGGRSVTWFSSIANKHVGANSTSIRIKNFPADLPVQPAVRAPLSLATANQKEITGHKVALSIKRFQAHATDVGSPSVQIAVATEKIINLARHLTMHKKDKHSNRGFQMLTARRKSMMQYLKRRDLSKFKETVSALGLDKEASHI